MCPERYLPGNVPSISQAQAAALADGFLNELGSLSPADARASAEALPVVLKMLGVYGQSFLEEAIANLNRAGAVASGGLASKIAMYVQQEGGTTSLSVGYPEGSEEAKYYDYVNKGVRGTQGGPNSPYQYRSARPSRAHVKAILDWLALGKVKVRAADVKKYGAMGIEQKNSALADPAKAAAYAIATNLKKRGMKATRFFDDAIAQVFNPAFFDAIAKAAGADVRLKIRTLTNGNNR